MTVKDRTSEFNAVVQSIKQTNAPPSTSGIRDSRKGKKEHEKSQFFIIASQIGRDISETAEKLDRLTKLAKRKSLFDDPTIEIQELTSIISQDIKNLNNQISSLHQRANERSNKQIQIHSETVVDTLKFKLRDTTMGFSEVLKMRTENLKEQQKDRENFTGSQNALQRRIESPLFKSTASSAIIPMDSESSGDVVVSMPQTLMTQERYVSNRVETVVSIEKTITELQSIFRQLATLVAEQQELLQRIDHDVDNTVRNVDRAQNALTKALQRVSSNRMLVIKIFGVLIFFVVLFLVFFV